MTTHVALLRAVNLGRKNAVGIADLRRCVGDLGFADVQSLLLSGNVVFTGAARSAAQLEGLLETEAARRHLVVMALKDAPQRGAVDALQRAIPDRDTVRAVGRELYVHFADGIGRSRLTNAVIERRLGTRGTGRNWNTVLKLGALAARCGPGA